MISRDRMAAVDRNAEALGVPRRQLMESSGNAIARTVRNLVDPGETVAIVAGRGNNGGDGFVAARFLADYDVEVQLIGRPETITTDIARANWEAIRAAEYEPTVVRDSAAFSLPSCDLVVDALVGTGVTGALREPIASVVEAMNDADVPVLSVDVPSGVNADTGESAGVAVAATHVITFHDTKPGLAERDVPVTVADIGIPEAAERFVGPGDLGSIGRDPDSHKGDAGRIVVIGGGPYAGAPALSALSAMRAGADLGFVACPSSVADAVQSYAPDLIVRELPGDRLTPDAVDDLHTLADPADCVVLGPGLGDADESLRAVREFLRDFEGRCVVDAEALTVIPEISTPATLICTPHQGELVQMGGPREESWRDRATAVEAFAAELGHTVLVKGHYDVISDGADHRVSRTGNPGMTVGGTGDVLAGAVATFAAQLEDSLTAAAVGAYVNGRAGDLAAADRGFGLVASDVLDRIPAVLAEDTA